MLHFYITGFIPAVIMPIRQIITVYKKLGYKTETNNACIWSSKCNLIKIYTRTQNTHNTDGTVLHFLSSSKQMAPF